MNPEHSNKDSQWTDEFESGRQEVIEEMEECINRWQKFLVSIRNETKNMAYSKEKRDGIELGYENVLSTLSILKMTRENKNKIGTI